MFGFRNIKNDLNGVLVKPLGILTAIGKFYVHSLF